MVLPPLPPSLLFLLLLLLLLQLLAHLQSLHLANKILEDHPAFMPYALLQLVDDLLRRHRPVEFPRLA